MAILKRRITTIIAQVADFAGLNLCLTCTSWCGFEGLRRAAPWIGGSIWRGRWGDLRDKGVYGCVRFPSDAMSGQEGSARGQEGRPDSGNWRFPTQSGGFRQIDQGALQPRVVCQEGVCPDFDTIESEGKCSGWEDKTCRKRSIYRGLAHAPRCTGWRKPPNKTGQ